ncbi:MAG: type II methionyl aminopeptidase [Candidatus Heimdallarchaeota archaeon]|nr:type II methionyl aminopeptidase [Candidatus Heimdallarchaeota archaeon]
MSKQKKQTKTSSTKKKPAQKKTSTTKSTAKKPTAKKTTPTKKKSTTTKSTTKKPTKTKKSVTKTTTKKSATKKSTTAKKPTAKKTTTTTKKPTTVKKKTTITKKPATTKKVVKKVVKKTPEVEGPLEFYLKAGEIAIAVKKLLRSKVKVGASVLEICEAGEAKIKALGGLWAFPLNISINNVAAHYSAQPDDDLVIRKGDIVKVDCGVHIDGYIADTAFTVSFGTGHKDLIKASEEATKAAIDLIRPGISTDRIGNEIEDIIRSYDFRPIRELGGHQLDQNLLHGPIMIPNVKGTKGIKLEENQAYALETFATSGTGRLLRTETKCYIFQLNPIPIPLRLDSAKRARKVILSNYSNFPFTTRWIAKELTTPTAKIALRYLADKAQIKRYPVLSDVKDSLVSQSEHTVFLTGNSRIVTTQENQ